MTPRPSVLLVEDEPACRAAVVRALGGAGIEVACAGTVGEAERLAAERDFDAALLDVGLPDGDGIDLARRLGAGGAVGLPVLLYTGLDAADLAERAFAAGAADLVRKPARADEIRVRVEAAARRGRERRGLEDAEAVLFALARAVEARDGTTGDHCDRVAKNAVALGRALGLGGADLEALRRGGVLHDVGKVGVPDAVLRKPGRLDEAEWAVMRTHPVIGAALLEPLRTMRRVLPIVRHHHERWDGGGYPDGLEGERIPLLARVFQVVDAFDALTSRRPYKPPLHPDEAVRLLLEETSHGKWDPRVVERFAAVHRADRRAFAAEGRP